MQGVKKEGSAGHVKLAVKGVEGRKEIRKSELQEEVFLNK